MYDFEGLNFDQDSVMFQRKLDNLRKLPNKEFQSICEIFGLEYLNKKDKNIKAILRFLIKPLNENKKVEKEAKEIEDDLNSSFSEYWNFKDGKRKRKNVNYSDNFFYDSDKDSDFRLELSFDDSESKEQEKTSESKKSRPQTEFVALNVS